MSTAAQPNFWAALMPPDHQPSPDGLDTVTEALLALSDGVPVPQRAAQHLAQALQPCLHGDNDIAGRLGLRAPGRGHAHKAPAALKKKLRRDELIRSMVCRQGLPAASGALALQIVWLYHWWQQPESANTAAGELARDHGKPLSHRQILRIAKGEPTYTRRRKK